ncbi:MAG: serine/threonine protein kinase [Myxococcales bacterium]|nr:serine/threonine protein kinase [Myxococcales bacterium]
MGAKDVDPHEETRAESIRPGKMQAGLPIGGYSLEQVLGEGGMGVVWSAHDPNLDRRLAIKVLKRQDAAPALRKRLLREARAMARLKHPNVLTVYEVGTDGDRDFIAMELVEGGSLDEWLDRQPPRDDVMKAILAAGRGLAAAHAAGLVHRDFKPHNVLRSIGGRVLVTDFGLARGMGDDGGSWSGGGGSGGAGSGGAREVEVPADAALDMTIRPTASRTDSLLDSPLTHTGAMIGTPAYMAPEQFRGGAPDPRTDQFAFCVTAWQALTGTRPYTGTTLDELRKAASAGIAPTLKVDLPPAVRAALARGLEPDPEKRWPTLDDLLDALDHAVRPRRPRWIVPAAALALIGVMAIAMLIARRSGPAQAAFATGCGPGEDALAEAWSPKVRTDLIAAHRTRGVELPDDAYARFANPMDAYRSRWTQAFATACKAPEKVGARQRACLLGARDQMAALAYIAREGSAPMISRIDVLGILPELTTCAGDTPNAPVLYPDDPVLRTKVLGLLARAFTLAGSPNFARDFPALEAEAKASGWPPMLPVIQMGIGNELLRRGNHAAGRAMLLNVLAAPSETRDAKTTAVARFGVLDATLAELSEPRSTAKPGELHHEIARLLEYARADVKVAGTDATLAAALAAFEARAAAGLAQWGRYPRELDEAIAQARKAEGLYKDAGDARRSALLSALVAEMIVLRGHPDALDDAMFVTRTASEVLVTAKAPPLPMLDHVRATIELARGEFALAQQLLVRAAGPPPPVSGSMHTGVVVGASGKPVANARVVAWRGELIGDPTNVITDVGTLVGDHVETGPDGSFEIHAEAGDALIAEFANARSAPALVTPQPARLVLAPTTDLLGSVDRKNLVGVTAEARYAIGANAWSLRVPITKDRSFHLAGMPPGAPRIGASGDAAQGQRRVVAGPGAKALTWPIGQAIEVIVRSGGGGGDGDEDAMVWLYRGKHSPARRADAEALAERAGEVAWASLGPVGADNTDAGRAVYEPGDRHAVISGNLDGEVSACVARGAAPDALVRCQVVTITQTIAIDPEDGPRGVGVSTVIFPDGGRGKPAP